MNYDQLKALAKVNKCSIKTLIVLAPPNDPFYYGTPADIRNAQWFASLWEQFGFDRGVHLRRIHYVLVSQKDYPDANGKPYENTERCWQDLNAASKAARCLKLVPATAFVARRNPPAQTFFDFDSATPARPYASLLADEYDWRLPAIAPTLEFSLDFPEVAACGYEYRTVDQPFLLEVWCEKSTMNDVLIPVCQRYGANFVTGLGNLSITAVLSLIERTQRAQKPARVVYVSDFDPAGVNMPRQIARQIEFWLGDNAAGLDIALDPIALTREQVDHHALPRIPIKDTDRRGANFEAAHGEGACELDALEALHPGSLRTIVTEALDRFIDPTLRQKLHHA